MTSFGHQKISTIPVGRKCQPFIFLFLIPPFLSRISCDGRENISVMRRLDLDGRGWTITSILTKSTYLLPNESPCNIHQGFGKIWLWSDVFPIRKKTHQFHCCDFDFDTSQTVTSVQSCQLRSTRQLVDVAFAQVPNEKLETSGAASGNGSTWIPWMWMDW